MEMMVIVFLAALSAGFLQSVTGFGGALILMMALPYFLTLQTSVALAGLICAPMCLAVAIRYRRNIKYHTVLLPTLVYLISSTGFIRLATLINLDRLKAVFGILLILLAIYFNFFARNIKITPNIRTALICGGLSGLTGGLFGVSGPLMVLYFLAITDDKEDYLGTVNLVFAITESYSALVRYLNGLITNDQFSLIGLGFIAVLLGSQIGGRVVSYLDSEKMKKFIYLLLAVSGLITFLKAINIL